MAIKTTNIITSIVDVDETWIFETYLKLEQKLIGQEVVIKSVFNPSERTPSFTIFFDGPKRRYYWKDFSSSRGGTAFELVQQLYPDKNKGEIATMLIASYKQFLQGNPVDDDRDYKQFNKYKVDGYSLRGWNSHDQKFWTRGAIGSKLLEKYNVAPIQQFSMTKVEDNESKTITITRDKIYGYFKNDGSLARIYQPGTQAKYLKVQSYVQGSNQLKYDVGTLVLLSGLKDGLSFSALGIEDTEFVAPDSENTMIPDSEITKYLNKYKKVLVCFDEDTPGKEAMERYTKKYPAIKPMYTNFGVKDIFDAVSKLGTDKVKNGLLKLL